MDDGVELWLVRHGETTASARRRIAGGSDPPLTDNGRNEAASLQTSLDGHRFDSVWSSDMDRALTTARLAWGEPRQDPRLREIDFGRWEGVSYDEVNSHVVDVFLRFRDFDIEGGDSHGAFRKRVLAVVDEFEPGRHLLFVHGGVIRVLTQDLGLDRFVVTGTLVVVDWSSRRLVSVHEPGKPPEFNP